MFSDRIKAIIYGVAVGDALGAPVEFCARGRFPRVTEMQPNLNFTSGGQPLPAGSWTDDASQTLLLAESLLKCCGLNQIDNLELYTKWWKTGYLSSTGTASNGYCGKCFDIGNQTKIALQDFEMTRHPETWHTNNSKSGNGSLMRVSPVACYYLARRPGAAGLSPRANRVYHSYIIQKAGLSSKTTHGSPICVDACRYFTSLLIGALLGKSKQELLSPQYYRQYFSNGPKPYISTGVRLLDEQIEENEKHLEREIESIALGGYKTKLVDCISTSGYVVNTLEAVLYCFYKTTSFEEALIMAVNLGDDADTVGAILGALCGAYYGFSAIPPRWTSVVVHPTLLDTFAFKLAHC